MIAKYVERLLASVADSHRTDPKERRERLPVCSTHTWTIAGTVILVREVVGNGFGLASALARHAPRVWAWPVGMIGNVLLFTVFVGGVFDKPQEHDLWGQAARQVFFFAVSAYGWWRWRAQPRTGGAADGGAIAAALGDGAERAAAT